MPIQPSIDAADLIPTEDIGSVVQSSNWDPTVVEAVAWIRDHRQGRGKKATWPRWQHTPVPAGTKAEMAEFEMVTMKTAAAEVNVEYVGLSTPLSRELIHDAATGVPRGAIEEAVRAVRDRFDADGLSVIATAPETFGSDSDGFDLDHWGEALARYKKLKPPGSRHAFIGHSDQIEDLLADMRDNGATLLPPNTSGMFGATTGLIGMFENVAIFETQNVPASGDGWGGCFTPIGDGLSGIGVAVAERLGVETEYVARRKGTIATVAARYGVVQTNPARILRVVSRAAA